MKILIEAGKANELEETDINLTIKKANDLIKIYSRIFTSNDGKMILEDLANMSGMYRSNFIADNDRHTAYLEGQRALFLYICSQLENNINNMEENL
ncbi:Bbp19 family protein [Rickettsia endosymbiont of Orchestes rusci]|uniref:Bbp19 family protein n=1 Tax=Rickettsia endosymbiont of Orchestes rusci TaxID=3066250 RepID=UPI00313D73C9